MLISRQVAVLKFKICKVLCFGILAEHGLQKALREGHVVEGLQQVDISVSMPLLP